MSDESLVVSKKSYRDSKVWRKAIELSKLVYFATEDFPQREHYGLAAQMRRAAVSVASNIAEGASRHSNKDYANFLIVARGSLHELVTQIEIACEVHLLTHETAANLLPITDEISKMLSALRSRLTTHN